MKQDNFFQRKKDVLSKIDKSFKGSWDKKIIKLCEKINSLDNYYTTSSCSGRVVIMIDQEKKERDLFLKVYHDKISFKDLKENLKKIDLTDLIKFKQAPPIIHVVCENFVSVKDLLRKAQLSGWKKSGIISSGERFILELNSTEKLEFPIIRAKKILVDNEFLKIVLKKANDNLKKGWEKIEKLRKIVNRI